MQTCQVGGSALNASAYGDLRSGPATLATIAAKAAKDLSRRKARRLLISLGQAPADESRNDLRTFLNSLASQKDEHE